MSEIGSNVSPWGPSPPKGRHVCADIHFNYGADSATAPVTCRCGWCGVLRDWHRHAPRLSVQRTYTEQGYEGHVKAVYA
jgi:hypothetical protein